MKYWVYLNGEVPGSYTPAELAKIPGVTATSLVCPSEGNPADRNWQRAGLFPDIIGAIQDKETPAAAAPAAAGPEFASSRAPLSPGEILNDTSQRLFRHVTELMKELENRREEQALTQSLMRSNQEVKGELAAARERLRELEDKAAMLSGFEDRERKFQDLLGKARADIRLREQRIREMEDIVGEVKDELEKTESKHQDAAHKMTKAVADKSVLEKQVADLSSQLAEKELNLAKSLEILHRLEKEIGKILPEHHNPAGSSNETPPTHPAPSATTPKPVEVQHPVPIRLPDIPQLKPKPQIPKSAAERVPLPKRTPLPVPHHPVEHIPYTQDQGKPEAPIPLPPEGILSPIHSPLVMAFKHIFSSLITRPRGK